MKKGLAIGIIFLFLFSTLVPIDLGINNKNITNDSQPISNNDIPYDNPPNLLWKKLIGGNNRDTGEFIQQTNDNGYIIAGFTLSYGAGNFDGWLVKIDINGIEQWNKTYGGPYDDAIGCVRETSDGGFILVGYQEDKYNTETYDVWLIKTDIDGNVKWEKIFPGPLSRSYGDYIILLNDGYLLKAETYEGFDHNIWLIKTDFNGTEIWNNTVGINGKDISQGAVNQNSEGDFLIAGYTTDVPGFRAVLLIKVDSNGNRLWRKIYQSEIKDDDEEGFNVFELNDGYIVQASSISNEAFLIKTDWDGNVQWRKNFIGGYWAWSSFRTSDDCYIMTGIDDNFAIFIFKSDENYYRSWEFEIGGLNSDAGHNIIESNDGNYVIVGESSSFTNGNYDLIIAKFSPLENIRPNIPNKPVGPTTGKIMEDYSFTTRSSDPDGEIVYYTWDWGNGVIFHKKGPGLNNENFILSKGWGEFGSFNIRVKAFDVYGGESEWSEPLTIKITIPRTRALYSFNWLSFLDHFPIIKEFLYG